MRTDDKGRPLYERVCDNDAFVAALQSHCDWFSAVPDSVLRQAQRRLGAACRFSPRENHAVAMAFGARVGGARPCVLLQNSGLGLALDALLGTFVLYGQGLLLVVSNRGELAWEEPQHLDWGKLTVPLLEQCPVTLVDFMTEGLDGLARAAELAFVQNRVVALMVHRGNLDEQD